MKHYKFLKNGGNAPYACKFWFSLPEGDVPGAWMPAVSHVKMCQSGYHACRPEHLSYWIEAELYEIESQSEWIEGNTKDVTAGPVRLVRRIPLNSKTLRLFACDCAERALKKHWRPKKLGLDRKHWNAPMKCIEMVRAWVRDDTTLAKMRQAQGAAQSASWSASWSAVQSAAWSAAQSAQSATQSAWSAVQSAGSVGSAGSAARSAAWSAAQSASWSAAWSVSKSVTWSAARSAGRAENAAQSAEYRWQSRHLLKMLGEI